VDSIQDEREKKEAMTTTQKGASMKTITREGGFTLIELIMVIVILGLLAAVAIPKFTNLSSEATVAAEAGMVGGVRSAIATLHAGAIGKNLCGGAFQGATMTAVANGCWPVTLDGLDGSGPPVTAGLFGTVLEQGGTTNGNGWSKTTDAAAAPPPDTESYTGPTTTVYSYNNSTGAFN
jgi:prepilin-type N-terminal cleavage/methylation domain-containing protein